jgi:hypothetical protein
MSISPIRIHLPHAAISSFEVMRAGPHSESDVCGTTLCSNQSQVNIFLSLSSQNTRQGAQPPPRLNRLPLACLKFGALVEGFWALAQASASGTKYSVLSLIFYQY